jgi:hypothetical protein
MTPLPGTGYDLSAHSLASQPVTPQRRMANETRRRQHLGATLHEESIENVDVTNHLSQDISEVTAWKKTSYFSYQHHAEEVRQISLLIREEDGIIPSSQ